eukprot:5238594-Pleurochrysis_carterae.AAC.1
MQYSSQRPARFPRGVATGTACEYAGKKGGMDNTAQWVYIFTTLHTLKQAMFRSASHDASVLVTFDFHTPLPLRVVVLIILTVTNIGAYTLGEDTVKSSVQRAYQVSAVPL